MDCELDAGDAGYERVGHLDGGEVNRSRHQSNFTPYVSEEFCSSA
jgi:hypothetical protein